MTPQSSNFGLTAADMRVIEMAVIQSECTLARQSSKSPAETDAGPDELGFLHRIEVKLGTIA